MLDSSFLPVFVFFFEFVEELLCPATNGFLFLRAP
jgi:hypothetical protein